MSILESMLNPSMKRLPSDQADLLRAVGGEVNKYIILDELGRMGLEGMGSGKDLDNQSRKLDVMLKKKQLGMDYDDDEYDKILNGKLPQAVGSSLMNSAPKHAILRKYYKTAHAVDDLEPNILNTFKGGIENVARSADSSPSIVKQLTRFIGRRR